MQDIPAVDFSINKLSEIIEKTAEHNARSSGLGQARAHACERG